MTRAVLAGCVALAAALAALLAAPVAVADPVVDAKVTAERGDDGTATADIVVINTIARPLQLTPVVVPPVPGCVLTVDPDAVAGARTTTVTVTIPMPCFGDDPSQVAVDLDGAGDRTFLPATVVSPPKDEPSHWAPLWWGLFAGLLLGGTVGLRGWTEMKEAAHAAGEPDAVAKREATYREVRAIVDARMAGLSDQSLGWKERPDLKPYTFTSKVATLEAGWSFQDSWVSNITVSATALIALLTSTDALTAVLGAEPGAAIGVMTLTGLASAALIGIANTVLKLVGEDVSEVTVGGLVLSTAIVVLAAGMQVWTVALVVMDAVGMGAARFATLLLALAVTAALAVYGFRSLGETVRKGFRDSLPEVPPGALTDWVAPHAWERQVVEARIRATYAEWLQSAAPAPGTPGIDRHDGTDRAPDVADWASVTPAPTRRRRAALL